MSDIFKSRGDKNAIELGNNFTPKFDQNGLIPCITTDAENGDVLMFAFMNAEALKASIETGQAHYYSRSRQKLWHKGERSGLTQKIIIMRTDCDQDCIWISAEVARPNQTDGKSACCHQGYESCFYRDIPIGKKADEGLKLNFNKYKKVFDPKDIY